VASAGRRGSSIWRGKSTVEKDQFADWFAVEGNLLEVLAVLEKIRMVMKGGIFMKGQLT
jgi:hypothetical protein